MPEEFWAAFPPVRTSWSKLRSNRLRVFALPRRSIDKAGRATIVETHGRHDPCVGIRATPIAEAMLLLITDGPCIAASRAER